MPLLGSRREQSRLIFNCPVRLLVATGGALLLSRYIIVYQIIMWSKENSR